MARYRETLPVLRQVGRWREASMLHTLGAQALSRGGGSSAEAEAARGAATQARSALLDAAPPAARAQFEQYLNNTVTKAAGRGTGA